MLKTVVRWHCSYIVILERSWHDILGSNQNTHFLSYFLCNMDIFISLMYLNIDFVDTFSHGKLPSN